MQKDTSDTWDFKALHCPERRKYFKNLWKKWSIKKKYLYSTRKLNKNKKHSPIINFQAPK